MKKTFFIITLIWFVSSQVFGNGRVLALGLGGVQVVINEVAWGGSTDSANDEWIELYNAGDSDVDLTGWKINDDNGADLYTLSGSVVAHGYYLVERNELATSAVADVIASGMSLSNSGDSLILLDASGGAVDSVNTSGGAWFSGNYTTRATMERLNANALGDDAANWVVSSGSGATASKGSQILGTPKAQNSGGGGGSIQTATENNEEAQNSDTTNAASTQVNLPQAQQHIFFNVDSKNVNTDSSVIVNFDVKNVSTLFAYGMEINYDPAVLSYVVAQNGGFLGENGDIDTTFEAALKDLVPGKIYIAEARTQTVKSGRSGSGNLFSIKFNALKKVADNKLSFGGSSFLNSITNDLNNKFVDVVFSTVVKAAETVQSTQQAAATQILVKPVWAKFLDANERYAIKLQWEKGLNADFTYKIYRKNHKGDFKLIGQTKEDNFIDKDSVGDGGKIVPKIKYGYKIVAVLGTAEAEPIEVVAMYERGIKGDIDRTDLVDGRDLAMIAKKFGAVYGDKEFDYLLDFNFDGKIDGADLIELSSNFAKSYKQ